MSTHHSAATDGAHPVRRFLPIVAAFLLPVPWALLWIQGIHPDPLVTSALSGLAILGAAFILSWAAEVFQMDVSQALALALLALIAVLPEYAVDAVFAFEAGRDHAAWLAGQSDGTIVHAGYAVANMTGANRLLIGIGWSAVVLLAWFRHGARAIALERSQAVEMSVLLIATVYALSIPFKGELSLVDTAVLLVFFGAYTWMVARAPAEEPHLVGPAATFGRLSKTPRRATVVGLFVFAAGVIFISAEPFAHGLVDTGKAFGIDEFLLVQWLAPLASEAPEFIVALLFVWRGQAAAGLRTLVSSKVNQWTLLIATLPVVFSAGAGHLGGMPLVERQQIELWLTAAQSLFAVILISEFLLNRWEALALLTPFVAQLLTPTDWLLFGIDVRLIFTAGYVIVGLLLLLDPNRHRAIRQWPSFIRESIKAPDTAAPEFPASPRDQSILR